MSIISFSDALLTDATKGIAVQCFSGNVRNSFDALATPSFNSGLNSVTFYRGTLPTDVEMNTFEQSSRSVDALLSFSLSGAFTCVKSTIVANFGTRFLGTIIKTGTMTWFNFGSGSISNTPKVFGSIGLSGSGADLIVSRTLILDSDLWTCTGLSFTISNEISAL
jgi:hypothetical protein